MPRYPLLSLEVLLLAAIGCTGADKGGPDDSGGDTGAAPACANAESILLDNGDPSGFERCEDGAVNRTAPVTVTPTNPGERCRGDEDQMSCNNDGECTDSPNGQCSHFDDMGDGGFPNGTCGCEYSCSRDEDCGEGRACVPSEVTEGEDRPVCVAAECRTSADCESGECGFGEYFNGCYWEMGLHCREAEADACRSDADCEGNADGEECAIVGEVEAFACTEAGCAIGRPLLVGGSARAAEATGREDWRAAPTGAGGDPGPEACALLAAHWARVAALEHASVGSFARFTLQLLALGAPPGLLLGAQEAAADEVRHARFAYGLASRFAGRAVGPGPLPLDGAMPPLDAEGFVTGLIEEACVGETLGAAEAAAAAEAARDPEVRAGLEGVARDEARHAALAWRSLVWVLAARPELLPHARERFGAAVAAHEARLAQEADSADLAAWGLPRRSERRAVQRMALRGVVASVGAAALGGGYRLPLANAPATLDFSARVAPSRGSAATWSGGADTGMGTRMGQP